MPTGERFLGQTCNTRDVVRPLAVQSGDGAGRPACPFPSFYAPWITMQNHIRSAKVEVALPAARVVNAATARRSVA